MSIVKKPTTAKQKAAHKAHYTHTLAQHESGERTLNEFGLLMAKAQLAIHEEK